MVWTSAKDPVQVGDTTLHRLIAEAAGRLGDRPALVDGPTGTTVSYRLLASRIETLAAGLAARSFGPGEVLGIWAPNLPQWAGVALGAMAAGGAVTGANPAGTEHELVRQLADARASVLVTVPSLAPVARAAAEAAGVREVIALGDAEDVTPISALLETGSNTVRPPAVEPSVVALLPYSSGTTGLPKGVMLTHANLVASVRQVQRGLRLGERDTTVAVAPFFHVMGFVVSLAVPLAAGATVVTLPRFDLERFLGLVERHRATVLVAPPPLVAALARHPMVDGYDLSRVELIVSGGAPLGPELQRAVAARFPGVVVGQGWGLTETAVGATVPDRDLGTVPGSVGRVMPSTELRVVDPATRRDLAAGERGELLVRGPQVMAGYLRRPEATAATVDADGWLRTGDLGFVDRDGNVFVADRLKELIKVSAYQVAPAELEALLLTHPAVADAAVIGRPDATHGEVPVAVVVCRAPVDEAELSAFVAERVTPYKRLRAIRFAESLPRTPSGKLLRRALRDQVLATATATASGS
jgi:acyl-CoA synthetase (AMP-forming)/AMP-acid ligase II